MENLWDNQANHGQNWQIFYGQVKLLIYWRVKEMNKYIMINHDASINEEMHVENSMADFPQLCEFTAG